MGCRGWQGEPWLGGTSVVAGGGPRRPPREPWPGEAHWAIFRLPLALFPLQSLSSGSGAPSANQDARSKPQKAGRPASPDPGHKFPPDLGAHGRHKSTTPCWSWAACSRQQNARGTASCSSTHHSEAVPRCPSSQIPFPAPSLGPRQGRRVREEREPLLRANQLRHKALTHHRLWMGTGGREEGRWGSRGPPGARSAPSLTPVSYSSREEHARG